uniref:Small ribosomal subunit protein uS4c n=1 Tax=Discoplastis spathirhyncha TaxID=215771 RepID=A0A3G3LLB0_9EUGL|nr:ribosomal protein S4 [Discoplastis spathirhyncha]AYQ93496.1 ribosomal protein S4 [Discoplastis spathirhyncha]
MSKYRGPKLRIVRRIGKLPGLTQKIPKKTNPPGQHGLAYNKKQSQYEIRLKEKQKLRFHYGIGERQLLSYIKKSKKMKGSSGKTLLTLLEMRLDNIIYRLGFSKTIVSAKQLISHGHVMINKKMINIPSYLCKPQNIITIKNSAKSKNIITKNLETSENNIIPEHLSINKEKLEGKINNLVNRNSISLLINELLVVEYYSRKL